MDVQNQRSTVQTKGACLSQPISRSMAAILRDSFVALLAAFVRTRPQAKPLSMTAMKQSIHGLSLVPYGYGAPLGGPSGYKC